MLDLFLGHHQEESMMEVNLQSKCMALANRGLILLPFQLTAVAQYLGSQDTSSLPSAVLTSPAMGETASDGRGYPVVKLKPGMKGRGHDSRVACSF